MTFMADKIKIPLLIFFISTQLCKGGNPFDTTYIKVFKQNFTVVTDIYAKGIDFSISPYLQIDSIDLREIKYLPNVSSYYGLFASYKGWGLGVSLKIPSSVKSDSI